MIVRVNKINFLIDYSYDKTLDRIYDRDIKLKKITVQNSDINILSVLSDNVIYDIKENIVYNIRRSKILHQGYRETIYSRIFSSI